MEDQQWGGKNSKCEADSPSQRETHQEAQRRIFDSNILTYSLGQPETC